ncbi:hypothetical protein Hanom_Chr06g00557661 [Helianthus anomalus]
MGEYDVILGIVSISISETDASFISGFTCFSKTPFLLYSRHNTQSSNYTNTIIKIIRHSSLILIIYLNNDS